MNIPQDEIDKYKPYIIYYLTEHNCTIDKPFTCFNPDHPDHHPSMRYWDDIKKCKCFACGKVYDIYDLVIIEHKCSFNDAFEIVRNEYGDRPPPVISKCIKHTNNSGVSNQIKSLVHTNAAPPQTTNLDGGLNVSYAKCFTDWTKNLPMTNYLSKRSISFSTAQRHQIGFNPDYIIKNKDGNVIGKGAVVIPTSDESYNVRPTCDDKEVYPRYQKRGSAHIFNSQVLLDNKTVFVVEGEIDAMSVEEVGLDAVALGGGNIDLFLRFLNENNIQCSLILLLDNDDRGRCFTTELSDRLKDIGITYKIGSFFDDDHPYKDPNEALIKDRAFLKQKLAECLQDNNQNNQSAETAQAKDFLFGKSVAAHKEQMLKTLNEETIKSIPTGIAALDDALLGGLRFGTYVLGGIPSCGKSTLALQIASNVAESGNIVIYLSLEMAEEHLVAKSIARELEIKRRDKGKKIEDPSITATDMILSSNFKNLTQGEKKEIIDTIDMYYNKVGENIIIIEKKIGESMTAEEIKKQIESIIEKVRIGYGNEKQVAVVIDYLQIIPTQGNIVNDKMSVDVNMTKFQTMANALRIPVVIISSLARNGYNKAVTLDSFKESGGIEYSADILIGLQYQGVNEKNFDLNKARKANPRKVELVILKQRMGPIGQTIKLDYYPTCDLFIDTSFKSETRESSNDFDEDDDYMNIFDNLT